MNNLLVSILLAFSLQAQAQWNDFAYWNEWSIEKKMTPQMSLTLTEGTRFNENVTHFQSHYSHLTFQYKFTKRFSASIAYRNNQRFNFDETIDFRHRFQMDLSYKFKLKNIEIGLQQRFQTLYENINRSADWRTPRNYLRTKLTVGTDLDSKFNYFTSAELFYSMSGKFIDNLRFKLGTTFEQNKKNKWSLYYMIDQDVQVTNPLRLFAVGTSYTYSF